MKEEKDRIHDLAIVGCGPAGLSAAINARARNLDFVLLGSEFCSPKLYKAQKVNNYLGYYDISGDELRNKFLDHIKASGLKVENSKVDGIYTGDGYYSLMAGFESFNTYSIILATGINYTDLVKGEEELVGRGISYCATCDAGLFKGKKVAAISYTRESIEEVEFLVDMVKEVVFIPSFQIDKTIDIPATQIIKGKPVEFKKDGEQINIKLNNQQLYVDGVFIFREVIPPDKLVPGIELTGPHIEVNKDMETNLEGIFAAGDCTGTPYQLGRAVGQGQIAALNAASYLSKKKSEKVKEEEKIKV